ncbi:MAG: class I SAM-dependent methyltransferase [Verrucomicrobia bacterium]|nr:class I SAM-dependent methyltransferase [Verrucomicrobiota bacterium]
MDLRHRLYKLVNGSALRSFQNAAYRRLHPVRVEDILAQVDTAALARIRQKYATPGEATHWPKYVDAPRWLRLNVKRAQELRLITRPRPLRILDLGSGGGYFLLVSRFLGHSGLGLDIDDPPMYGEMFEAFGLQRVIWTIKAFEALPDLGQRFDLVTAFSICFNEHKNPGVWGPEPWAFLLQDLKNRLLKPSGEIFLGMNPEPGGIYYTPGLREFFLRKGARVDRAKVWFKRLDRI